MKTQLTGYVKMSEQKHAGWAPQGAVLVGQVGDSEPWGAWIEPGDYRLIAWEDDDDDSLDPRPATIEVDITEEMQQLIAAWPAICYDGDENVKPLGDEAGYDLDIEIFWAVTYRGGLAPIE